MSQKLHEKHFYGSDIYSHNQETPLGKYLTLKYSSHG